MLAAAHEAASMWPVWDPGQLIKHLHFCMLRHVEMLAGFLNCSEHACSTYPTDSSSTSQAFLSLASMVLLADLMMASH